MEHLLVVLEQILVGIAAVDSVVDRRSVVETVHIVLVVDQERLVVAVEPDHNQIDDWMVRLPSIVVGLLSLVEWDYWQELYHTQHWDVSVV